MVVQNVSLNHNLKGDFGGKSSIAESGDIMPVNFES